jgi:hypothetical protein
VPVTLTVFFVNTSLGQDNFYPQKSDVSDVGLGVRFSRHTDTEALRVGYRWKAGAFSYGLETGYVNLGPSYADSFNAFAYYESTHYQERIDGVVLGPTVKYDFPMVFLCLHEAACSDRQTTRWKGLHLSHKSLDPLSLRIRTNIVPTFRESKATSDLASVMTLIDPLG